MPGSESRRPTSYIQISKREIDGAIPPLPYLCAWVATIFATVWAREDWGLTWKTGYESLPSFNPLSVKITVRK